MLISEIFAPLTDNGILLLYPRTRVVLFEHCSRMDGRALLRGEGARPSSFRQAWRSTVEMHGSSERGGGWRARWGAPLESGARKARALVVLGFVGFAVAAYAWPASPVAGIVLCPFRALTSYDCPGCGMTRSCTQMMHGDLWESLSYHPLGPIVVVSFALVASWRGAELLKGRRLVVPALARREIRARITAAYMGGLLFALGFGGARLMLEIAGILTPV